MITEIQIKKLIEEHFTGNDLFLVDMFVKSGNLIHVFIDGDHGVKIEDCRDLSRFLENSLDRETEDFDLTVSSAGADRPLKLPRQYKKNIGKELEVVTDSGEKITGVILNSNETGIELEQLVKKSKKEIEKIIVKLKFDEIKSAKEVISFKK
jgi:ribosome maturation factor RimP